jgi:hypothetical protein
MMVIGNPKMASVSVLNLGLISKIDNQNKNATRLGGVSLC